MNELTIIGLIADIIGIVGAIGAVFAWFQIRQVNQRLKSEDARLNEKITVVLQNGANIIKLPAPIRRKDLRRAELLGRIGMIRPAKRFQLESLNTEKFFTDLDAVVNGSGEMTLTISLTDGDYRQFVTE